MKRIVLTAAAVLAVTASALLPAAANAASAHCGCTAGPHPAYLITFRGIQQKPADLATAKIAFRVMAYEQVRHQAADTTVYRVPCWNSKARPRDRVSVRRIRHHLWGAYVRFGHRLIARFRF